MKKLFCILLAVALSASFCVACGGDDTSNDASNASAAATSKDSSGDAQSNSDESAASKNEETESSEHTPIVLPTDPIDRDFFIIERWFGYGKNTIDFTGDVLYTEDQNGELNNVNQAKKDVIDAVQEEFSVKIEGEMYTDTANIVENLRTKIENDISTGTGKYDFFFESPYYYTSFVADGHLADLTDKERFPYLDLEASCWDQNAVKDLSICNSLYFLLGDINTFDNDGTFVMLFNKGLYERLGFTEDLYKLVRDEKWTFDKFTALATQIQTTVDLPGTSADLDEFDQWFCGSETYNLYSHTLAAGEMIVKKDNDDIPQISMCTQNTYNALGDAVEFYTGGQVLVANDGTHDGKYSDVYEGTVTSSFRDGRELFYICSLIHAPFLRDMDEENAFGILPIPKYSETQDRYYCSMSVYTYSTLMVPNTDTADADLSIVIQALAQKSQDILTPEYYEKQLKYREARDDESAEMLDIIFENRVFDLGAVFSNSWGDAWKYYTQLDTNIESRFKAVEGVITDAIDETVKSIKKLHNFEA